MGARPQLRRSPEDAAARIDVQRRAGSGARRQRHLARNRITTQATERLPQQQGLKKAWGAGRWGGLEAGTKCNADGEASGTILGTILGTGMKAKETK